MGILQEAPQRHKRLMKNLYEIVSWINHSLPLVHALRLTAKCTKNKLDTLLPILFTRYKITQSSNTLQEAEIDETIVTEFEADETVRLLLEKLQFYETKIR